MAGLSYGQRRFLFRGGIDPSTNTDMGNHSVQLIVLVRILSARPFSRRGAFFFYVCLVFFVALLALPHFSVGQSLVISTGEQTADLRVNRVTFEGDLFFSREELQLHVRSKPNRELLGLPGFTWWLWLYNFGEHTLGGKRLGKAFKATGEPPAIFDSTTVARDLEQLQLFYNQEGFLEAELSAVVEKKSNSNQVSIQFNIVAGRPTFIRTFKYNGLDALDHEQKVRIARGTLLDLRIDNDDPDPLVQRLENRRYSEPLLSEDGRRLLIALHNEGYAAVALDSIHAVVYRINADSVDVTVDVKLGPRYRFGDVFFSVTGPESSADDRFESDSLHNSLPGIRGGLIEATFHAERRLQFHLFERKLDFRPGEWYDQSKLISTKRRLDGISAIAFTEIRPVKDDSTVRIVAADVGSKTAPTADSVADTVNIPVRSGLSAPPRISHRFNVQSRRRHQLRLQTFIIQRNGSLAEQDNEWGFGAGITYTNLNPFGGGENFTVSGTGSLASEIGVRGGFTSAQWEIRSNLAFPYLTWPMGAVNSWFGLEDAKSHISLSFLAARRDALKLILRGRGLARYRFELNHTRTLTSLFDLMELTISNPDTLDGFQEIFLDDVLESIEDPVQRATIIEDYTEPQFNDARRLTLRWANVDPLRRDNGYVYEAAIESGGNLGYLLDRFVFTPGTVEGTLPGLPIFGEEGSTNRLIYRRYVRAVIDIRKYNRINSLSVFAWKILVGAAHPYGKATLIPLGRRFFSGGATSVRAWHLSELGPGSASVQNESNKNSNLNTNIFGGEIKLEGSVELRHTVFRNFMAADWVFAMFIDAGNVWFGPRNPGSSAGRFQFDRFYQEIGVGAGIGIRLEWEYLIIRLDFSSKVHDPVRKGDLWPDGFSDPVVHFGFGHTF